MRSITLTCEQAIDAIRGAAVDGRIHCITHPRSGGIMSETRDVEEAVNLVRRAERIAWEHGPFRHDLTLLDFSGTIDHLEASAPGGSPAEVLLAEHGALLVDVLADRTPDGVSAELAAHAALTGYLANDSEGR